MTASPVQLTPPQGELVPIETLRRRCRFETDENDERLQDAEQAAIGMLDGYSGRLGRCILRQQWALALDDTAAILPLPFPDCRDFAIERQDAGVWSVVEGATISPGGCDDLAVADLPEDAEGLRLTFWAGWDTPADVPGNVTGAVGHLVAHLVDYDPRTWDRVAADGLPRNVSMMISSMLRMF